MARQIALFPLQIVVFPGEAVNLHIFEQRYRDLVQDCLRDGITFGIPSYQDGKVMEFGTEVCLIKIEKKYPGGEMDIRTRGQGIFRIQEFYPTLEDKLYSGGLVRDYEYDQAEDLLLNEEILSLTKRLFTAMNIDRRLPEDISQFSALDIVHYIGLKPHQEYELLLTFNAIERQKIILHQIEQVLPVVKEMEQMKTKARLNGHFKNLIPPNL